MRILVTGANGFVGTAICEVLERNSFDLIRLSRNISSKLKDEPLEYIFADITDSQLLDRVKSIGKIDAVIHAAGLAHQFGDTAKEAFWKVNVEGTKNVAQLANQLEIEQFILISSVSVYGEVEDQEKMGGITEDVVCNPDGFYAESKFEAENVCRDVLDDTDVNLTILRLSTVIGEGDIGNVFRLINLIKSGKFVWIGKGNNRKSLIYKSDVAKVVMLLLQNKKSKTEVFNVTANAVSMKEIVEVISERLDVNIISIRLPTKLVTICLRMCVSVLRSSKLSELENSIIKWVSDDNYSGDSLFKEYKLRPETSIGKALEKEVGWYLDNK